MLPANKIRNAGFSLIELSVWITLIAIFMSTMLSWLTPAAVEEADKITITNKRLDKIEQALENYRVRYGRLPCPASADLSDSDGEAYREFCVTVKSADGSTTENIGVVPVKSLGLQSEDALDGWGRRFTYHISKQLCDVDSSDASNPPDCDASDPCGEARFCTSTTFRCGDPDDGAPYTACTKDVTSSRGTGDITIYRSDATAPNTITTTAAYVIVSHGPDGQCAYMPTGDRRDLGSGCTPGGTADVGQDENYFTYGAVTSGQVNDKVWFTDAYGTTVDGAIFDDLVRFKTKSQIEARTLDTYTFAIPLNPVTAPAKLGCTDTIVNAASINSVYEAINYFDTAVETNINNVANGVTYFSPYDPSDRFLGVLWTLQEICAAYYPSSYSLAVNRACPHGAAYPGSAKSYDTTYHGCL